MRNKFSKFALAVGFVLTLAFTLSCSSDNTINGPDPSPKQETYYMEQGAISETAYNLVKGLDMPAEDAVSYCHRYPYPTSMDKYAEAESGMSRAKLEEGLDGLPGNVKPAVLRSLDRDGAVFGLFKVTDGSTVFLYIEKEK